MKRVIQFIRFSNLLSKTKPDSAFINANIITMNPKMPLAQALSVKNGRITAVGTKKK